MRLGNSDKERVGSIKARLRGTPTMNVESELSVTVSGRLFRYLKAEAKRLEVPLEWLVASIVADSIEQGEDVVGLALA